MDEPPGPPERAAPRPGDDLVPRADVVMDRVITVPASPGATWPWLVQLGKGRAGWYLPRALEHALPRSRRALRRIDPAWQGLQVGDVIPDYGGASATFEVAIIQAPSALVYIARRGRMNVSWAITLTPVAEAGPGRPATRLQLRLRLGPVRHRRLAQTGGGLIDAVTIALMAAGLRERVAGSPPGQPPAAG